MSESVLDTVKYAEEKAEQYANAGDATTANLIGELAAYIFDLHYEQVGEMAKREARIAELEAENARLLAFQKWVETGSADDLAKSFETAELTRVTKPSMESPVDEGATLKDAPQNGTEAYAWMFGPLKEIAASDDDAPPGTAWDAGGNLRAVDDGGWMDEED